MAPGTDDAALQQYPWRSLTRLSSVLGAVEQFLGDAAQDLAPWTAVAFGAGIAGWFWLGNAGQWAALIAGALAVAMGAGGLMGKDGRAPYLRQSIMVAGLVQAAGCACVWAKAVVVGTPAVSSIANFYLVGTVLAREDAPALGEARLMLVTREPESGRAIRLRLTMGDGSDATGLDPGAVVGLRARVLPPPLVPGCRNTARDDWFAGISGAGRVKGAVAVLRAAPGVDRLARLRDALAAHVMASVPGSAGGIAATLVSGNRGGIDWADQQAMRDAGLTHLLAATRACAGADIVFAIGAVPSGCGANRLTADTNPLAQAGGLALDLRHGTVTSIAGDEGDHPWAARQALAAGFHRLPGERGEHR